jgi:predicted ATPase/DNA-binding SARP family transcriptional activator
LVDGRSVREEQWARRKSKPLVKLLALQPQHRLHREQLIELLWPEQTAGSATNSLYKALHAARRSLEPRRQSGAVSNFILARGGQIILSAPRELWVDAVEFERRAGAAFREQSAPALQAALELYQGDLLPEDLYEDWAAARREHLRSTHHRLLLTLGRMYVEQGRCESGLELLERLITLDPSNEEAHRQMMLLYASTGRRAEALRQYRRCEDALRVEMDGAPERATAEIRDQIACGRITASGGGGEGRAKQEGVPAQAPEAITNLRPALTSFVSRKQEIADVLTLLSKSQLLTLTGAGGIGKTRLALAVAANVLGDYQDGVWFVDLSPIFEPALAPHTVTSTLGVREDAGRTPVAALHDFLRPRQMLLVVDNCEHLIEACAKLVDELVRACPRLRILATSREALGVCGESVWSLSTMSLPEISDPVSVPRLMECEAVQLFVERARLSDPRWRLTEQNGLAVAKLCRRLDGIPLAIELAASRLRVLAVEQILSKLDNSFNLLANSGRAVAPRHQTLDAAMDWSYELLRPDERLLWGRLSVFSGGWTLPAVEAVAASGDVPADAVLDLLTRLVDKSLVVVEQHGAKARYRMLETIRQYGAGKLRLMDEEFRVGERHYNWCLQLAEKSDCEFSRTDQRHWFEGLEAEHDNLRAALRWSTHDARDADKSLRLCTALWHFWQTNGYASEGRLWFEAALALEGPASDAIRARAFHGASGLASIQGDLEHSLAFLEESLALRRRLGDKGGTAHELQRLGIMAYYVGDYARAAALHNESLNLCLELGDESGCARAYNGLGILALDQGSYERAEAWFDRCLTGYQKLGHKLGIVATLNNLGETAQKRGDFDRSQKLLEESLERAYELGDKGWAARALHLLGSLANSRGEYGRAFEFYSSALVNFQEMADASVVFVFEGLSCTAAAQGNAVRAHRLAGAASARREMTRMKRSPADQLVLDRYLDEVKRRSTDEEMARAFAAGHAMTLDEAIQYALRSDF